MHRLKVLDVFIDLYYVFVTIKTLIRPIVLWPVKYSGIFATPFFSHYVFQGTLFQHRFLEQLIVTKIWSLHLRPIYLPAIVVIVQYRVFSV